MPSTPFHCLVYPGTLSSFYDWFISKAFLELLEDSLVSSTYELGWGGGGGGVVSRGG
jgi:hypothetical protein